MKKHIAKKTIILYVLKMLKQASSKEKPLSYISMARVLNSLNVPCDRKTISRNVDYLIEFGYPIIRVKGVGCYMDKPKETTII